MRVSRWRSNQVLQKRTMGQTKSNEKNLTWTDQDSNVFAEVQFDPQYRGSDYTVGWATIMERLAPKKSLNERIFEAIQEAYEGLP